MRFRRCARVLQLRDHDPYDYALVERPFPPSARGTVEFRIFLKSVGKDILEFELLNERSERALRLRFDSVHAGLTFDLAGVEPEPVPFSAGEWHHVKLAFDGQEGRYDVWLDGQKVKEQVELAGNAWLSPLDRGLHVVDPEHALRHLLPGGRQILRVEARRGSDGARGQAR